MFDAPFSLKQERVIGRAKAGTEANREQQPGGSTPEDTVVQKALNSREEQAQEA